ncbi:protocadherin Fat 4-like [Branchiostoma floridae x Branchiostoma belcheri]
MQDPSGLNERYFDVHNETGEITVISGLDREKESSHEFFVEPIADSGCARQSLILVVITLEDINDNNPVFEDVTLRGTVRENTPPGEPVTVIPELAVTDEDDGINGRIALLLDGVGSSDFGVNSTTRQIYVDGNLDYETVQSYSLTVVAMDRDGMPGHRTATAQLTIELQDENDNPPQFSPEHFHFFVSENSTDDALVGIVLATDLDSGQDGKVDHFIVDGGDGVFQLDPSSGQLTLVNGDLLDREAVSWYTVTIRAQDRGLQSLATFTFVNVTVTDVNDNAPSFDDDTLRHFLTREPIRATENLPAGSRLFTMTVTDPDDGVNGAVHLHVNSDEFSVVMLPNSTEQWTIVSNGTLDREERETYELSITASDMGTPALSSSVTIVLSVGDVNDVPPTFVDPPDEVPLLGGSHPGTLVAIFAVEDPDVNGTVTYSIAEDQDGLFGINNEGVVVLNQRLPNVVVTRNVTIAVTDGLHLTNTTLRVHAEDGSSLVSLEFGRESYNFDVIEDSAPSTLVGNVNVSSDQEVLYSFQSAQMGLNFIIDNNTGEIVTRLPLDRENIAEHYLIAVATESAVASRKAYATVAVRVLDVNDNAPEFDREDYDADVSEDAPVGHTIVLPSASDADVGENARIVYSKVQGNDTFEVDPETGAVLLNGTLDRETDPIHIIVVQATDNGTSPRSATATVSVHVIDVNDNGPIFAQEYYNVSVTENDDNKLVLTAVATDIDFGANGRVRHYLIGADNFTIGELTGDISSTFNFDRESVSYYNFTVLAVDGGDTPYSSSAEISVTVADVNDNRPVFLGTPYRQKVAEDTPNYTSVFTLTATDADFEENGTVSYEENPGGICGDLFLVNVTAGVMTTRQSLLSINPTYREHCVAIVTAYDHGRDHRRTSVEVVFNITDSNRHRPVFVNSSRSEHYSEAWNVRGRELFTVMATDADPGVNGEVSYKIVEDYGMFELRREDESVQVWANRSLDREERDFYNLTLVATDGAVVNPLNATETLDIWVDDANDNPPKFVRDNFTMKEIRLFSNTSVGTHVTRVSSTDEDVGTNAVPLYRIAAVQDMRLDSPTHLFTINSQTGDLNISSEFPKLTEDYFVNVTLSVEDAMNPNLRADELKLRIVVPFISTNKHAPRFPQDNYTVELTREGLLAESGPVHLITVSAEDGDTGPDGQVDYSILNRADTWYDLLGFISMTGPNVSLHVNSDGTVFNSTDDYPHRLVIQAQDRGQPAKTGTTEILLSIQEAGTEAPTPVVVAPPMPDCSTTPIIAAGCVAVFAALLAAVSLILYARNRLELKRVYSVAPEHVYEVIDLQATRLHDMKLNERTPLPPIAKQLQPDRNPLPPVREAPRHLPRSRNQPPQPRLPPVTRRSGLPARPRARAPPTVPKLNYSTDSSYVFENDTSESDTDGEYVDTMHTRRGNNT